MSNSIKPGEYIARISEPGRRASLAETATPFPARLEDVSINPPATARTSSPFSLAEENRDRALHVAPVISREDLDESRADFIDANKGVLIPSFSDIIQAGIRKHLGLESFETAPAQSSSGLDRSKKAMARKVAEVAIIGLSPILSFINGLIGRKQFNGDTTNTTIPFHREETHQLVAAETPAEKANLGRRYTITNSNAPARRLDVYIKSEDPSKASAIELIDLNPETGGSILYEPPHETTGKEGLLHIRTSSSNQAPTTAAPSSTENGEEARLGTE